MSDDADIAFEIESERVAQALANRVVFQPKPSATHCGECGDPIPTARRVALPGVQHCVHCAEVAEDVNKFQTGRYR